eukprot:scaffold17321_cov56-Isochrysis_galbana.AAC.1
MPKCRPYARNAAAYSCEAQAGGWEQVSGLAREKKNRGRVAGDLFRVFAGSSRSQDQRAASHPPPPKWHPK